MELAKQFALSALNYAYSQPSSSQYLWDSFDDTLSSTQMLESPVATEPGSSRTSSNQSNGSRSISKRKAEESLEAPKRKRPASSKAKDDREEEHFAVHDIVPPLLSQPYIEKLPWGLQWEIARLHLEEKWEAIEDISMLLKHQNTSCQEGVAELHKLAGVRSNLSGQELRKKNPWPELDDEAKARKDGQDMGACLPARTFGRVRFNAQLNIEDKRSMKMTLGSPEIGQSCRFARVSGSTSIIHMSLKRSDGNKSIVKFLEGVTFRLFGRNFQVLFVKDETVVLHQVTRDRTLLDVMAWHNPVFLNAHQPTAKWAARFQLGLSATEPAILIPSNQVSLIPDFDGETRSLREGKLATNQTMTDGCGYGNEELFRRLQTLFDWKHLPSAVQFRYGGAKGMLLRLPPEDDDVSKTPRIFLRPSQIKIKYKSPTKNQEILEVVTATRLTTPFRASPEVLINLNYNGVPPETFLDMNGAAMKEVYKALTDWSGEYSMARLYKYVSDSGGVLSMRLERLSTQPSRARGQASYDRKEEESDGTEEAPPESTAWFPDPVSECPSTLEETVLEMFRHGFLPQSCHILALKLKEVLKKNLGSASEDLRLRVPMSAFVHCAPVPERYKHLLKKNEVHLMSARENLVQAKGGLGRTISGQALVTRYPCKVPSDIQKVTVVNRHELWLYADVMLMPIDTYRSLASILGGGDYDGDRVVVIWQPEIVDTFNGQGNSHFADPPVGFDISNFEENTLTVDQILNKILKDSTSSPDELTASQRHQLERELQAVLLSSLGSPNLISSYSIRHDKAVASRGYGDPVTIRLAYMFCAVLDAAKSGKRVLEKALRADQKMWDSLESPSWRKKKGKGLEKEANLKPLSIPGKPLLDIVKEQAVSHCNQLVKEFDVLIEGSISIDVDLREPWDSEKTRLIKMAAARPQRAREQEEELLKIETHVKAMLAAARTKGDSFTKLSICRRQDILRLESRAFADGPKLDEDSLYSPERIRVLKASFAYIHDYERSPDRGTRWPWNVAFGELCRIKARSAGGKPSADIIQNLMQVGGLRRLPS